MDQINTLNLWEILRAGFYYRKSKKRNGIQYYYLLRILQLLCGCGVGEIWAIVGVCWGCSGTAAVRTVDDLLLLLSASASFGSGSFGG